MTLTLPLSLPRLRPLLLATLLLAGCSQKGLLTREDYNNSQLDFLRGDPQQALIDFPRDRERGAFITTMEQTYLSLTLGHPEIRDLQNQAAQIENRVRYQVSREARNFFYAQTTEDYYASEHEIIWMHFLLSWGYSLQGKYDDACVEARVAGSLLSLPWSPEGHFDDPAMRLFLAGLWTMCGNWADARVDLRAAWDMDHSLIWAKELAERKTAPAQLFMVLGGPGPEPVWDNGLSTNPLRSERRVNFKLRGLKSPLSITSKNGTSINTQTSPDAQHWYARHLERESELHELILDSAYGGRAALNGTVAVSKIALTTGVGVAIATAGTALGLTLLQYATNSDMVISSLGIIYISIDKGLDISNEGFHESTQELKQELDPSITYRFVRYLPEYLWMGWSDKAASYPVQLTTPTDSIQLSKPSVVRPHGTVSIAQLPDFGFPGRFMTACSGQSARPLTEGFDRCAKGDSN